MMAHGSGLGAVLFRSFAVPRRAIGYTEFAKLARDDSFVFPVRVLRLPAACGSEVRPCGPSFFHGLKPVAFSGSSLREDDDPGARCARMMRSGTLLKRELAVGGVGVGVFGSVGGAGGEFSF